MNSIQVRAFAQRLMQEVWEPFDSEQLPAFYHEDVIGHHRSQTLSYNDVANRLAWDRRHSSNSAFDIKDIIADEDFDPILYDAAEIATGQRFEVEVIYLYHLQDGKISEFWLLASVDFDYKEKA